MANVDGPMNAVSVEGNLLDIRFTTVKVQAPIRRQVLLLQTLLKLVEL